MLSLLFSFSGRIGRAQFWLSYVIQVAFTVLAYACLLAGLRDQAILLLLVPLVIGPIGMWIGLAAMTKRYHDHDKSAWWILIVFIPIVGGIWQLVELGLLRGTDGANQYGADPGHSFNVADDLEALRRQAGGKLAAPKPALALGAPAPIMPAQIRSPYTDNRPVFGKRV